MTIEEAILERHSVRSYLSKEIEKNTVVELEKIIKECNDKNDFNIQLITNEKDAFKGFLARYGHFENVNNYIALIGENSDDLNEKMGYWGEHIVLHSQMLGLNTCWVGGTFSKRKIKAKINKNEKLVCVITIGYGTTQGKAHKSKSIEKLYQAKQVIPPWFFDGVKAASLAPTALNQQKFIFTLEDNCVKAISKNGFYTKVDLGIAKYHFEVGAKLKNFTWSV